MDLIKTQLIESVFAGGGEMGARMRALDWSTTVLGPVEQWPQSLRVCVRVMLGSGYPMLVCWGPDYTMLYNDAYGTLIGTKHPAALACNKSKVLPEAWDFIGPRFERVMSQGQDASTLTDQMFTFFRNNYLEECYFSFSYSPIQDDNGKVAGVLTACLESTERVIEDRRRQVLRDLASRTAEIRHEEEVWRVSAETLSQYRQAVPFALLYDYKTAEYTARLVGVSVGTTDALHPAVVECTSKESAWPFQRALAEDCPIVELGDRAANLCIPGWMSPPRRATILPIRLREHTEAAGFLVVGIHPGRAFDDTYREFVRRIAEQIAVGLASARAYDQERRRAEALAEIDRAKTAFFSNVSHEFRTPLALMLGPLEDVLQDARERLRPGHHEQLVTVRRNALRLLKLVNTLLDFSRIEAGRVQAVFEPIDLSGVTAEIASVFRSAMENAGLNFLVECPPIPEPVYVDRDMWEKIVSNLLSNAFKFTFKGSITVALNSTDCAVELRVRDTGVGIPEEHRERIFERFHRIEGTHARTYEGTGIGLAFIQELVRLHGGAVRVESTVGKGTTFVVTVPLGTAHLPPDRIQAVRTMACTGVSADVYAEEARRWLPDDWSAADVTMLPRSPSVAPSPRPELRLNRELIVVADDNADMRQYLRHLLGDRYEVHAVSDGRQALETVGLLHPALLLADVMMPQLDGFSLLRAIREDAALSTIPVILLSARAGEESRVEGLQAGADDYLVKPFTARELLARVEANLKMAVLRRNTAEREERLRMEAQLERQKLQASEERLAETSRLYGELQKAESEIRALKDRLYRENLQLREEVDRASMFEDIVGSSQTLKSVLSRIDKVAPADSTVLISGETGTGKELIARAIHKHSNRSGRAFVSVNCAALAPTLLSSELFGHEKGAFTGATQRRLGRFELADGGTLFLDEIGELLPDTQVALLRVLQEREFERVGGARPIRVDVRVIAATNRNLKRAVAQGTFRQDLFYRLNVFPIEVPPLRERKDDILMLVEYFVQRYAKRAGKNIRSIDKRTLRLLQDYDWPGNIRELQNVLERSVILSSTSVFAVDELWLSKESPDANSPAATERPSHPAMRTERQIIEAALAASRGRVAGPSGAAASLQIPPSTLEHRIRALKISKTQFKFG
ncbi:MAG TPA: sigma 54-interacting transcriptional regulator [Candidatus Binatia bacterium]|nr:sigma 54-interacting transcriptional regulator [Candidatus Binatia bacterium]